MLADRLVHHRLRGRWLVRLVVAVAAITDEVDDHVLVEALPVRERQARDEHHRLRIVAVHVEDRRLEHLGDVRAIHRRARIAWIGGGEAHLVVHDDVDGAAGEERPRLRELQRLHDHALAGEGRVAVDQDGQHTRASGVAAALLTRAHRAFDDGIHDLEVRGIERQRHVHITAGRTQVRREALVVLHVARALHVRGVVLAFEFVEQHRGGLAEHVDQHVEAAAMGHADDALFDAPLSASLDQVVHQRDQRIAAFERERFWPTYLVCR